MRKGTRSKPKVVSKRRSKAKQPGIVVGYDFSVDQATADKKFTGEATRYQQNAVLRTPGHGEVVGGAEHQFAEEIAKLARKKGGKDAIQKKISERIAQAHAVGQSLAERTQNGAMQHMHEAHTDKVVCSAIGAFEQQMKLFNGLPPSVVMSSYTICRMLDALGRAGYSANGKK